MKTLHQIFLQKFIILFTVLLIVTGSITYYWVKDFYINQTKTSLLHNIYLVSYDLDNISKIDNIAKHLKKDLHIRLTIIDNNGIVIVESHKDKKLLNNHKNRKEIIQASNEPFGFSIRHSATLNTDLLYVAKKYKYKNHIVYIRMAREVNVINQEIVSLAIKIAIVLFLFFVILFFITYKMSKAVQEEINNISQFLRDLTKKRKTTYINSNFSRELNRITKMLSKVALILTKKDKQKQKYTAKLQLANTQKDDIISAISHEFKNPIAVISGYTQTLLEEKDINNNIRNKFLQKIYKSSVRLNNLIDTLRLSIKLEDGKQSLNCEIVDLEEFLQENIDMILLNYKDRDIKLQINEQNKIKVDKTLFSVAVVNLIENGLKYSQEQVTVILNKNSICIKDEGIGIDNKEIANITQKFYRVSNNGWNNSLGLGLSIVSNILNAHKFKLTIQSKKNQGSTFCIVFQEEI